MRPSLLGGCGEIALVTPAGDGGGPSWPDRAVVARPAGAGQGDDRGRLPTDRPGGRDGGQPDAPVLREAGALGRPGRLPAELDGRTDPGRRSRRGNEHPWLCRDGKGAVPDPV